jgi:hypothetical protein
MKPANKSTLLVKGTAVAVFSRQADDFISLTDIAKHKEPDRADQVIQNWMRNRNTVEFLGIWESLNNPDFKPLEFEGFRNRAGLNSFVLTNLESLNSVLIRQGLPQPERLATLNDIAITQLRTLLAASSAKRLK